MQSKHVLTTAAVGAALAFAPVTGAFASSYNSVPVKTAVSKPAKANHGKVVFKVTKSTKYNGKAKVRYTYKWKDAKGHWHKKTVKKTVTFKNGRAAFRTNAKARKVTGHFFFPKKSGIKGTVTFSTKR